MKSSIRSNRYSTTLELQMAAGESLTLKRNASLSVNGEIETGASEGDTGWKGLKSAMPTRKTSAFVSFECRSEVSLSMTPGVPGHIGYLDLKDRELILLTNAYLASESGVILTEEPDLARDLFTVDDLLLMRCGGRGRVWFSGFGRLMEINVEGSCTVGAGFILGYESTLSHRVRPADSGGEAVGDGGALMCDFSGSGRLFLNSIAPERFSNWARKFLSG